MLIRCSGFAGTHVHGTRATNLFLAALLTKCDLRTFHRFRSIYALSTNSPSILVFCLLRTGTHVHGTRATNLFLAASLTRCRFTNSPSISINFGRFTNSPSFLVIFLLSNIHHEIFRQRPPNDDSQDAYHTLFGGSVSLTHHRHSPLHTTSTTSRISYQRHPSARWYPGPGNYCSAHPCLRQPQLL